MELILRDTHLAHVLNPVGGEAGPLREGDELILLSQTLPEFSRLQLPGTR
jgi:hypothetical protein